VTGNEKFHHVDYLLLGLLIKHNILRQIITNILSTMRTNFAHN